MYEPLCACPSSPWPRQEDAGRAVVSRLATEFSLVSLKSSPDGDERAKSVSCPLAKSVHEPFVEAVSFVASHQEATRSACVAACFIRVLSHFICVAVCPSQALTVSKSSWSRTP
jgi:hypothetical protein